MIPHLESHLNLNFQLKRLNQLALGLLVYISTIIFCPRAANSFKNTSCNLNNLKYAYPASQIPLKTSLAKRKLIQFKQSFHNRNEKFYARRDTQFDEPNFPTIMRHFENISRSHYQKIESVLFASNHYRIRSHKSSSTLASHFEKYSDVNHITSNKNNMPSKKRFARVRFTDSSRLANPPSTSPSSTRATKQPLNSQNSPY